VLFRSEVQALPEQMEQQEPQETQALEGQRVLKGKLVRRVNRA
jgi:hypothetical protein